MAGFVSFKIYIKVNTMLYCHYFYKYIPIVNFKNLVTYDVSVVGIFIPLHYMHDKFRMIEH